jgi:hypothetical protein
LTVLELLTAVLLFVILQISALYRHAKNNANPSCGAALCFFLFGSLLFIAKRKKERFIRIISAANSLYCLLTLLLLIVHYKHITYFERCKFINPALDRSMIHNQSSNLHYFLNITVTKCKS